MAVSDVITSIAVEKKVYHNQRLHHNVHSRGAIPVSVVVKNDMYCTVLPLYTFMDLTEKSLLFYLFFKIIRHKYDVPQQDT
jgi:hypothetical protein